MSDVLVKCAATGVDIGYVPEGEDYHKDWLSGAYAVANGIPTHNDATGKPQPVAFYGTDADGNYLRQDGTALVVPTHDDANRTAETEPAEY